MQFHHTKSSVIKCPSTKIVEIINLVWPKTQQNDKLWSSLNCIVSRVWGAPCSSCSPPTQKKLYTHASTSQGVPIKHKGMVDWHPLGTIWHPLEGPGVCMYIYIHKYIYIYIYISSISLPSETLGFDVSVFIGEVSRSSNWVYASEMITILRVMAQHMQSWQLKNNLYCIICIIHRPVYDASQMCTWTLPAPFLKGLLIWALYYYRPFWIKKAQASRKGAERFQWNMNNNQYQSNNILHVVGGIHVQSCTMITMLTTAQSSWWPTAGGTCASADFFLSKVDVLIHKVAFNQVPLQHTNGCRSCMNATR